MVPGVDAVLAAEMSGEVEVTDKNGERQCGGKMVGGWSGPLRGVPASFLEHHHDTACRSYSGLFIVMNLALGEITDTTPVSIILIEKTAGSIIPAVVVPS